MGLPYRSLVWPIHCGRGVCNSESWLRNQLANRNGHVIPYGLLVVVRGKELISQSRLHSRVFRADVFSAPEIQTWILSHNEEGVCRW